jgi:cellulose synthase operon protein C
MAAKRAYFGRLAALAALTMCAASAQSADQAAARSALIQGLEKMRVGDMRTANVHVLNAVKADPGFALAQAVYARILLELGNGEFAAKALDKAAARGIAEQRINHLRGHAALLQGDAKAAIALLQPQRVEPKFHAYAARTLAKAYAATGDYNAASKAFDDAIKLSPNEAGLWVDVGRYRFSTGNIASAIDAGERAVKLAPANTNALTLMGELVRTQYGLVASIPWFERALSADSQNLTAMIELAGTYGDAGKSTAMLALTRRIMILDQGNPRAYYLQAVLAARANKPELARGILYKIGDRLDGLPGVTLLRGILEFQAGANEQAVRMLLPLLNQQPGNDKVRQMVGAAKLRMEDYDGAIAVLMPLARRGDADSYALTLIGRAFEAKGDRVAAAQFLDRVGTPWRGAYAPLDVPRPAGNPNDAAVAVPDIANLIASGRTADALNRARSIQAQNPGVPAGYVLVGDSLTAMNQPAAAAEAYRKAANIRFNESTALRLARALSVAGKPDEGLQVLKLFTAQNPRSIPARVLSADVAIFRKDWDRAIILLEGLRTQIGNRDAMLLNTLSWAYLNQGNADKAVANARAAYALAPTHPVIANSWGWALYKTGRNKAKGLAFLKKASAQAPGNLGYQYQVAIAAADLGQKAQAKKALQIVLAAPKFSDREAAAKLLKQL